ncbi:MFS transporter [Raineyella fluvialis]|uniref:MFS transporter n=2 Tax=Raineyella fluvialis TaxID=2662261 RepID=A0A5Q2FE47_9ACTN|nr:MFS transporter [Raineyella fluvialis]
MRGPVHGTGDQLRVAFGSTAGAVIEAYDFIGFGTAAALYFGSAFFPSQNPLMGTLSSFATLGVGFVARPLGGIVGGHLGDKVGRKPVLVASLIVMGLATFLIGCLPTVAAVGVLAPVLLVTIRIIQGLAYGAEWGGAILMTYEHSPWLKRGKFTGIVQSGFPIGLLLANLVFLVSVALPGDWKWRVPFLFSAVLVIVGLIIRSKVPESPVFDQIKDAGEVVKSPIKQVIVEDWRNILRGIGLRIAETAGYAISITFMISYLHTAKIASSAETILALCIASAIGIAATIGWGALTDRIGRRPLYLWVTIFNAAWAVPMFLVVNTKVFLAVVITVVISYIISQNALAGSQGAWFPELFQANTRSSGASLAYQISAMISGVTPFLTTLLYMKYQWAGPAILFLVYSLIGLVSTLMTRETWGPKERCAAEDISARTPLDQYQRDIAADRLVQNVEE